MGRGTRPLQGGMETAAPPNVLSFRFRSAAASSGSPWSKLVDISISPPYCEKWDGSATDSTKECNRNVSSTYASKDHFALFGSDSAGSSRHGSTDGPKSPNSEQNKKNPHDTVLPGARSGITVGMGVGRLKLAQRATYSDSGTAHPALRRLARSASL